MDRICSYCGSTHRVFMCTAYGDLLCSVHRQQFIKHRKIFERTYKDPQVIVLYEDYAELVLENNKSEEIAHAVIDLWNVIKIKDFKFRLNNLGYAITQFNGVGKFLHQVILGDATEGLEWDHQDRNPLNNREINLIQKTHSGNMINIGLRKDNTSGFPGVYWNKFMGRWNVLIHVNKVRIELGYYDDFDEAVEVRKAAEIQHFGYNPLLILND